LFLGTHQENIQDAARKGKMGGRERGHVVMPRGEDHVHAKLTELQVRDIHRLYRAGGVTQRQIAADFGLSLATVGFILTGRRWAHVYNQIRDEETE